MNIKKYSIREKVLQTVVTRIKHDQEILNNAGAAFFFGEIITEANEMGIKNATKLLCDYQNKSNIPPLITSDFENGCGSMLKGLTPFPYLMSLGAANSKKLAYEYGKATALEARSVGANWSYSPVVDLNLNSRNPLVNIRSLGDNFEAVASLAAEIIKGMQDNGLAACAKHFPGDGVDFRDQHIITTNNSLPFEDWKRLSGYVFQKAIEAGVYSIMAGHITLPDYQKEFSPDGLKYPATLSSELIQKLLKGEMHFTGIVVTDALDMGGFKGWYKTRVQSEIESLKAGCDMVLWPCEEYVDEAVKAVENGYISHERLDDAVNRVMSVKDKMGLFDKPFSVPLCEKDKVFIKKVQKETAEKSITLVRDKINLLPLNKDKIKTIAIVPVIQYEPYFKAAEHFSEKLCEKGFFTHFYKSGISETGAADADIIIYSTFSRSFRPIGFLDFFGLEAHKIRSSRTYPEKTIAISFGSPYFGQQYFEKIHTYINAYSPLDCSVDACVDALVGEIPFTNYSPVDIEESLIDKKTLNKSNCKYL